MTARTRCIATTVPNNLFRNDGGGRFKDVAAPAGVAGDYHATTVVSGDYDNDGREDLYVASYLTAVMQARDYLYHNDGPAGFSGRLPSYVAKHDATHGVQFFDFDQDGDLDLMGADNLQYGSNAVFRNRKGGRALQVVVTDANERLTQAGSEVRLYKAGTRDSSARASSTPVAATAPRMRWPWTSALATTRAWWTSK